MEVIYTLIPGMIFLGLIFVGILIWAVRRGQYDDLEGDANRILMDDDDPMLPQNQKRKGRRREQREKGDPNWPDAD